MVKLWVQYNPPSYGYAAVIFKVLPQALPDPPGPLSSGLPCVTIVESNSAVSKQQEEKNKTSQKRQPFLKFNNEMRAKICRYLN